MKLGSKLGDTQDAERRKNLATAKLNEMNSVWIRNHKVSRNTKIRLYKAIVKPVLLYNASTWGLTKNEEAGLDSFHRQQLRKVLNVKYPDKMKNEEVYKLTNETPISLQIVKNRWKLFGHILPLNDNTPAQKSMKHYFSDSTSQKFRGRKRITLPVKLSQDIGMVRRYDHLFTRDFSNIYKIGSKTDLAAITVVAVDRKKWQKLVEQICKAAEAQMRL